MKKKTNHHLHLVRLMIFGVLVIGAFFTRLDVHGINQIARPSSHVLRYATSMSRDELLAQCNSSRTANGLPALTLNTKLNSSAQAKAQHMANNNYWAHDAPDGTQPWYFFEAAGYSYSRAGENLAYGFDNAQATNSGWMNSPGHKANILGDYTEVGFGFINSADFQGNENTVVVAHYAKPLTSTTIASQPSEIGAEPSEPVPPQEDSSTPPTQPHDQPQQPQTPSAGSAGGGSAGQLETEADPQKDHPEKAKETVQPAAPKENNDIIPVVTATAKDISVFESIKHGSLPQAATVGIGLTVSSAVGYAVTHRRLVKHAVQTGERYLIAHPLIDLAILTAALGAILTGTAAHLL